MSANPRSPESGDVPEYVQAGKDAAWYREKLNAALHRNGEYARRENAERARAQHLQFELDDRDAEVARLTVALSTARARADSAEAQAARLRRAGRALANMAYNFAQRPHYMLTDRDCTLFRESCDAWDAAIASTPIPDGADRAE